MTASQHPLVSICLPVYNGEKFLAQAIDSVLAQSYENFELLVSDDCSTDGSWAVIERYAAGDRRVKHWRNENRKGLFANYNVSMMRASGEIIKLFAQDDVLEPEMLTRVVEALDQNPGVALVSTAKRWIGPDGAALKVFRQFPEDRVVAGREVILYNLLRLTNWVGEPSAVAFRRARVGSGFDCSFYHYGDIEYWFRILEGHDFLFVSEVLCGFRRHPDSQSTKNLTGLLFALDILRLNTTYQSVLQDLGETPELTRRRTIEIVALMVDHLIRTESLTIDLVQSVCTSNRFSNSDNVLRQEPELSAWKELAFQASRSITEVLAELSDEKCRQQVERARLQNRISEIVQSSSWQLTSPIRQCKTRFQR